MKTEIIQTRTIFQTVGSKPCKECEEEEAQKKLLEQKRVEEDRVSLSSVSPLQERIASSASKGGLSHNDEDSTNSGAENKAAPRTEAELSQAEKQALTELKARDREVRAHEQAHLAAAGPYAKGPPSYEYQTGPDGKPYAVGGEVQIDTSEVSGNPQATLTKAQTIKRAATAPANPSAQDRQVAAQASRMEAEARKEIREQRTEEQGQAGAAGATTTVSGAAASLKAAQQTSETSQPARETPSNTNAADNSGIRSRLQKNLQQFSSPIEKGNLLDTVS
jgi:SprA family protein